MCPEQTNGQVDNISDGVDMLSTINLVNPSQEDSHQLPHSTGLVEGTPCFTTDNRHNDASMPCPFGSINPSQEDSHQLPHSTGLVQGTPCFTTDNRHNAMSMLVDALGPTNPSQGDSCLLPHSISLVAETPRFVDESQFCQWGTELSRLVLDDVIPPSYSPNACVLSSGAGKLLNECQMSQESCDNKPEDVVRNLFGQCSPEFGCNYQTPRVIHIHDRHGFSTPLKRRND